MTASPMFVGSRCRVAFVAFGLSAIGAALAGCGSTGGVAGMPGTGVAEIAKETAAGGLDQSGVLERCRRPAIHKSVEALTTRGVALCPRWSVR